MYMNHGESGQQQKSAKHSAIFAESTTLLPGCATGEKETDHGSFLVYNIGGEENHSTKDTSTDSVTALIFRPVVDLRQAPTKSPHITRCWNISIR